MSFAADVTNWVIVAKRNPRRARDGALLKLFAAVIKDTPVGNPDNWKSPPPRGYVGGRLRGNWQTNVGSPNLDNTRPPEARNTAIARISLIRDPQNKMEDVIYFTNNMPYAQRIEFEGHSSVQAPAGMMRKNIVRFTNLINAEARRVNR